MHLAEQTLQNQRKNQILCIIGEQCEGICIINLRNNWIASILARSNARVAICQDVAISAQFAKWRQFTAPIINSPVKLYQAVVNCDRDLKGLKGVYLQLMCHQELDRAIRRPQNHYCSELIRSNGPDNQQMFLTEKQAWMRLKSLLSFKYYLLPHATSNIHEYNSLSSKILQETYTPQ
ncbi:hypothetical protein FGO68_gene8848 [Halteria grandinella]|uniref:Uncharacterized protein n=1 Tax=Halteria grandinella TaxID=5974 RepID=A0A8J8P4N5_HALGN|nr:hypothetical protein FGO68_gene8848 [Halteria grandinella]